MCFFFIFFFFKQKTAYEMRISDWSSDVCSSDLVALWIGPVADRKRSLMALVPETDRLFVRPAQISGAGCRYGAGQIIVPPVHADPQIIPGEAGVDARGPTLKDGIHGYRFGRTGGYEKQKPQIDGRRRLGVWMSSIRGPKHADVGI